MKQYRVIVVLEVPFRGTTEMPYGPAQPSRFEALAQLAEAFRVHSNDEVWTRVRSIRIDVLEGDE